MAQKGCGIVIEDGLFTNFEETGVIGCFSMGESENISCRNRISEHRV